MPCRLAQQWMTLSGPKSASRATSAVAELLVHYLTHARQLQSRIKGFWSGLLWVMSGDERCGPYLEKLRCPGRQSARMSVIKNVG